jgi:uncharacterized protein YqjF (DUF2071 family)
MMRGRATPYGARDSLRAIAAQRHSLRDQSHRPWPIPDGRWLVAQSWLDLLFIHWSVPCELIRGFVPPELELDAFNGRCYVAVVPFRMRTVRFVGCPPVLGTSAFPEVNVRTYVTHERRGGVFFLSLDAKDEIAVTLGRRMYGLPYLHAHMSMQTDTNGAVQISSQRTERRWPPVEFAASYRPAGPPALAPDRSLERWLTERYCFYTATPAQGIRRTEIHHLPWQLQPATLELQRNTMLQPFAISDADEPLVHYSAAQHVVAWSPVSLA